MLWTDYEKKPIGGLNPYYECVGCGRSDPQINGELDNHGENCPEVIKFKQSLNNSQS